MDSTIRIAKLAICAPSDIKKELHIIRNVVDEFNLSHGDVNELFVKSQHWSTDTYPDMSAGRAQAAINRQMIDDADIVVGIFWSRFGSPSGLADSGTEEEIMRGIHQDKQVMVYFSRKEPLPADADPAQLDAIARFRERLQDTGLYWSFASKRQLEKDFRSHLAAAVYRWNEGKENLSETSTTPEVNQTMTGDGVQVGGNVGSVEYHQKPKKITKVVERRPGSISASEQLRIKEIIEGLVDKTTGKTRQEAFAMWGARLNNLCQVSKREDILSAQMSEIETWNLTQSGILTRGLKSKDPDQWRKKRIGAIKAAMRTLGFDETTYYPILTKRLKLKKPLESLKHLTKTDLERVYQAVRRDSRQKS